MKFIFKVKVNHKLTFHFLQLHHILLQLDGYCVLSIENSKHVDDSLRLHQVAMKILRILRVFDIKQGMYVVHSFVDPTVVFRKKREHPIVPSLLIII